MPLRTNDDAPGTSYFFDLDENHYAAVKKLVEGLPDLKELQLGDYKYKVAPHRTSNWGCLDEGSHSVELMQEVANRKSRDNNTTSISLAIENSLEDNEVPHIASEGTRSTKVIGGGTASTHITRLLR